MIAANLANDGGDAQARPWADARASISVSSFQRFGLRCSATRHAHRFPGRAEDAAFLAHELKPVFGVEDLINLSNCHFYYVRLVIDERPSYPFSARTLLLAPTFLSQRARL